jgi:hypothetical protein
MFHRTWIGAALVATLSLSVPGAKTEEAKYPNWDNGSRAAQSARPWRDRSHPPSRRPR